MRDTMSEEIKVPATEAEIKAAEAITPIIQGIFAAEEASLGGQLRDYPMKVSVNSGIEQVGGIIVGENQPELSEVVKIRVESPEIRMNPKEAQDRIEHAIAHIKPLADLVDLEDESKADHKAHTKEDLEEIIKKADSVGEVAFLKNYLDWQGFEYKKDGYGYVRETNQHAIDGINQDAEGVGFYINALKQEGDKNPVDLMHNFVTEHKQDITDVIYKQITEKYKTGLSDEEKAKLKEEISALEINFDENTYETNVNFNVKIQSPKQKTELQDKDSTQVQNMDLEKKKELEESNPLHDLTSEQLGKVLGRAFLQPGKDLTKDLFPAIAGAEDMRRVIADAFHELRHHDKAAADALEKNMQSIEHDDIFKKHTYGGEVIDEEGVTQFKKTAPHFTIIEPGVLEATINLAPVKKDDHGHVIESDCPDAPETRYSNVISKLASMHKEAPAVSVDIYPETGYKAVIPQTENTIATETPKKGIFCAGEAPHLDGAEQCNAIPALPETTQIAEKVINGVTELNGMIQNAIAAETNAHKIRMEQPSVLVSDPTAHCCDKGKDAGTPLSTSA